MVHRPVLAFLQRHSTLSRKMGRPLIHRNGLRRLSSSSPETEAEKAESIRKQLDAAAREDRLDLLTAARILFSTPPKPRKFGLDFHLWQFFVACLPPFAVYLTAQYARYEMKRMEKEKEQAQQLALETAVAEVLASQVADDGKKVVEPSSNSTEERDSSAVQPHKEGPNVKDKDDSVLLSEDDFLALKARLDAMESKVRVLESARLGTTFRIPLESNPSVTIGSQEHVVKTAPQRLGNTEVG